ncbi:ntf2 and rrm domain containing protein [Grosmannia clavigera kw1407]|uniref:Ntf2 and rrm domain containing protein n=1 Tax=Grosmannia clavigera (strain kw1407 / UAMH 11150) TaxID=655863 RepID=F0XSJ2_GROCL|nr:ntf2 and rrm domain containing protein [Grosmannia clavigera kw1407]EFW99292.1 ntf2 and rrm domain containing protein [Grosmannia clavigera kw1407]
MSTNGVSHEQYSATVSSTNETSQNSSSGGNLSKDEVGWYFVEQYYTTLSKSPDKLHLFYGKKSQFVYGLEAEVSPVSVGRQDIQERIHKLDFQDCKVRISNVDAQASFDNIVIQVIGETSNKAEEPRKFVQTFVLAQQPSGYFVLNDILRFIKEEEEDTAEVAASAEVVEPAAATVEAEAETEQEPEVETAEVTVPEPELDAIVVDKKLEEASTEVKDSSITDVATPAESVVNVATANSTESVAAPAQLPDTEKVVEEIAEEDVKKVEAPKEPNSTPAAPSAPVAAAPAEPEKPKGPPKPMTWASRAAAAAGTTRPAVAMPKLASPASSINKPAVPAAAPPVAPAAAAAPAAPVSKSASETPVAAAATPVAAAAPKDIGEWQTAGSDSRRQNRAQSISGSAQDKDTTLGYVKYVTEKVDEPTLRLHLESFGPVVYFDINRLKNCAFIEFASPAGYLAAVAANPHTINGENIVVEARRPKASAYGGANYSNNRGGVSGRGRGGYEGRGGNQGGGRGNFSGGQNRSRGGANGAARGRGAPSQVASA